MLQRQNLNDFLNEDYEYKDELIDKYEVTFTKDFDKLNKKIDDATGISVIRGVSDEAFNLKINCIDKINKFKKSKNPEPEEPIDEIKSIDLPVKFIASKSNIKIENDEDLDMFLNQIRDEVKKHFDEYDIVNLKL